MKISALGSKSPAVMGIDVGTTHVKAVIWDFVGRSVAAQTVRADFARDDGDGVTRPLKSLWERLSSAIRAACDQAANRGYEVVSVGITGHGNGLYLYRGVGFTERAIGSADMRASRWLEGAHGWRTETERQIGQHLYPGQTVVILNWMQSTQDDQDAEERYRPLFAKDWVGYQLTGELCTDPTDAHAGGLIDCDGNPVTKWHVEVRPSAAVRGEVTANAALQTGLPRGIPVAVGCVDLAATALGCGCLNQGDRMAIAGSWTIDLQVVGDVKSVSTGHSAGVNWLQAAQENRWLASLYSPNGTLFLDPIMQSFGLSVGEAERLATRAYDGQPSFMLDPDAGMDFKASGHLGEAEVLYAAYEGLAFVHVRRLEAIAEAIGVPAQRDGGSLAVTGGLASSGFWMQLLAGAMGEAVLSYGGVEAGSLGAAMCAGVAAGAFDSLASASQMIRPGRRISPNEQDVRKLAERYRAWRHFCKKRAGMGGERS